jgi:hypothetical protein
MEVTYIHGMAPRVLYHCTVHRQFLFLPRIEKMIIHKVCIILGYLPEFCAIGNDFLIKRLALKMSIRHVSLSFCFSAK